MERSLETLEFDHWVREKNNAHLLHPFILKTGLFAKTGSGRQDRFAKTGSGQA
jgi:hypothetical protein